MDLDPYMMPCITKSIFGIDCFGCGLQRSIVLLFSGEFTKAFTMFPAVYTTILFFITCGLHFIDLRRNYHKIMIFLAIINAIIMIIAYFYKLINI